MSDYDHGPLQTYEVTWMNGHVERVRGHQCDNLPVDFSADLAGVQTATRPRFVQIHGEINGRWTLVLSVRVEDIRSVRNVSVDEMLPGGDPQ